MKSRLAAPVPSPTCHSPHAPSTVVTLGSYGCTGQPPAVRGIGDLVVAAAEGVGAVVAVVAAVVVTSVTDMAGDMQLQASRVEGFA